MDKISKAIEILKKGGIVIFPTDTVYGIGCRIDTVEAVERLFSIKKRERNQPVPILVGSVAMAKHYADIPKPVEKKLVKKYWPGGLTLILRRNRVEVAKMVLGENDTIGLRMPNYPLLLSIINSVDVPIIGTSANFHGMHTPRTLEELDKSLMKKVDFVLKGNSLGGVSSTILDCTKNPWKILREGAVRVSI